MGAREATLAERIGRRLRSRRQKLGLTLAKTAEAASISTSYLSAVEKGVNLPSLPTLAKIVEALHTNIPDVLADEGANLVRAGHLPPPGQTARVSHPELQLQAVALAAVPLQEGTLPLPTKDHDVFGYIVEGELQVFLDGSETITLSAGDALDLRSAPEVFFVNRGGALSVWTSCPVRY
jgi:transcriptional regulator with XRE-family HTH domain